MPMLPDARGPDGLRVYAVGDIHGCLDLLEEMGEWVEADLAARPVPDWRLILLGDYVDRGPESAGVIDWIMERAAREEDRLVALLGNHDAMMRDFLGDAETKHLFTWLGNGGLATLASYGLASDQIGDVGEPKGREALRLRALEAVPEAHRSLLAGLPLTARFGDFFFVHAGVRPGVALEAQDSEDLTWIRGPFLASNLDFGGVVVHGHTPTRAIDVRANRIAVDTGAVFGGPLSCVTVEGGEIGHLTEDGHVPLSLEHLGSDI